MKNIDQFKGKKVLVLVLRKVVMPLPSYSFAWGDVTVNDASPEEGNKEAAALRSKGNSSHLWGSSS